jgi:transposase
MSEKRKYRRYSEDFKEEAVRLSLNSEKSVEQVAAELGISHKNLFNWRSKYRKRQESPGSEADKQRIKQLEKEVKELRLEREILKKAAAIFSQDGK